MNLRNKYILVTGAARRIGAAIARALAAEHANVIVHCNRSRTEADALVDELRRGGTDAFAVQADLANPAQVQAMFNELLHRTGGKLDGIVNNASLYASTGTPEAKLCKAIHVDAPLALIERLATVADNAAVVNILDTRVVSADPAHAEYLESKRLLADLTEELAAKFAPRIRVNAVAPGAVLQEDGQPVAALERLSNFNPLKAHGSPDGLAECVRFLLATDFITGQTICYDGGYRLRFRKNNS